MKEEIKKYNYKDCQSLFGYAADVHKRSGGRCVLCNAGAALTGSEKFDFWRQLTVEHIIGQQDGGYDKNIIVSVEKHLSHLSGEASEVLIDYINRKNTVSACLFCNSTTSKMQSEKTMDELIQGGGSTVKEVKTVVRTHLQGFLEEKKKKVQWKLKSIHDAYEERIVDGLSSVWDRTGVDVTTGAEEESGG
jgi:hypothetical protein